ncbi:MAG TPA: hypothetical protein VFT22_24900 [Kofleriaceae bacterium]|nr:hypothetical protein [Kofleriaceae bacterium]
MGEVPPAGGGATADAGGGGSGSGSGSGSAARDAMVFNASVKPLLTRCVGCHAGLQPPDLTDYARLDARYKTKPATVNLLVNKGDHEGVAYFNTTEKDAVVMWVDSLP